MATLKKQMVVYLGSDHGGFELKEQLKGWLAENSYTVDDLGAYSLNPQDDYPDFIVPVAEKVSASPGNMGIILGRSGNGEAIAANKIDGVRAAVCTDEEMARKARIDNDANILSLGADFIDFDTAKRIVKTFLETPFSNGERHIRRLEKITEEEAAN